MSTSKGLHLGLVGYVDLRGVLREEYGGYMSKSLYLRRMCLLERKVLLYHLTQGQLQEKETGLAEARPCARSNELAGGEADIFFR
jgi:hypothetical protein